MPAQATAPAAPKPSPKQGSAAFGAVALPADDAGPGSLAVDPFPSPFAGHASTRLLLAQDGTPSARVVVTPRKPSAPVEQTRPAGAASAPNRRSPAKDTPDDSGGGARYGLAPIRWGGGVSYIHRRFKSGDSDWRSANGYSVATQASSFILAPWLATVSGSLTLSLSESEASDGGSTGSVVTTGGLGASIFPVSRFPLRLEFRVSDSRTEDSVFDERRRNYRFSARQEYRPARGGWNASAGYDYDRIEADTRDEVHRLSSAFSWQENSQTLTADAGVARNLREDGFNSTVANASVNHSMRLPRDISVTSAANYIFDERSTGGSSTSQQQALQAYSAANWNPTQSPWSAFATARLSRSQSQGAPATNSVSLSTGSSYRYSRNLRFSGSFTASTIFRNGTSSTVSTSETLGVGYSGDPLKFGRLSYNWGLAASGSNANGNVSTRTLSTSANHSLSSSWETSEWSSLGVTGTQSVSQNRVWSSESTQSTALSHALSTTYFAAPSAASQAQASLSVSDSRTFGDGASRFQMANFQLNSNWRISRDSQFSGNLSIQRTWRKAMDQEFVAVSEDDDATPPTDDPPADDPFAFDFIEREVSDSNTSINGNLAYRHSRAFGVRNLNYSIRFVASTATRNAREFGDPDDDGTEVTRTLEQELTHTVGRLSSQLTMRVADRDGRKNASIFFRVNRSFGNY
ncbi:MAG: hypothetical protein KDH20_11685 [Rhodocyclaceae bacterium]|nr:hypothetical protein [Rhodocyclaceae bacterium]